MYKYHEKNGYMVMEYDFDSISDLLYYIKSAPTAKAWEGEIKSSERTNKPEWHGTKDFDEAFNLCKYGQYDDGFNKLNDLKIQIERYIKEIKKQNRLINDFVGFTPDVPRYLNGFPMDMFNQTQRTRKKVDIYFNCAQTVSTEQSEIFNKGAIFLSVVSLIEDMGIDVNVIFFEMVEEERQLFFAKTLIKSEGQPLDMRNAYFPICNPSFLRRIYFALREKTPDIKEYWTDGYGIPCESYVVKKFIGLDETSIIFGTAQEMGVMGKDVIADANSVFDFINRTSKVKNKGIQFNGIKKENVIEEPDIEI